MNTLTVSILYTFLLCQHEMCICFLVNSTLTNTTAFKNETGKGDSEAVEMKQPCSYKHPQFCHRHIKSIFVLYTRSGGWILLGIILCGVVFHILSHIYALREEKRVAIGIIQTRNVPLMMTV